MIVTIMQPAYLPWLGFFDRVLRSDLLIFLDHVQIEKGGFTNRNRIRNANGSCWLTIPIHNSGSSPKAINQVTIAPHVPWRRKHWQSILQSYAGAPYFSAFGDKWARLYEMESTLLSDVLMNGYILTANCLGVTVPYLRSSEMHVRSTKGELVVDLCKAVSASAYISGPFGRTYLNPQSFLDAGIELLFHDYDHPTYTQAYPGFEPYLSAIDVLFNHGSNAVDIITNGRASSRRDRRTG